MFTYLRLFLVCRGATVVGAGGGRGGGGGEGWKSQCLLPLFVFGNVQSEDAGNQCYGAIVEALSSYHSPHSALSWISFLQNRFPAVKPRARSFYQLVAPGSNSCGHLNSSFAAKLILHVLVTSHGCGMFSSPEAPDTRCVMFLSLEWDLGTLNLK